MGEFVIKIQLWDTMYPYATSHSIQGLIYSMDKLNYQNTYYGGKSWIPE
jgi:hypothetical protein